MRTAATILAPIASRLHQQGYGWLNDTYLIWWVLADVDAHLGQPDSAIAQLEAILQNHCEWNVLAVPYAAAHFRLGELYAQTGDRRRAREHFTAFLKAFTDPDPEYRSWATEARAELERVP